MCEFCENEEEIVTLGDKEIGLGEIISDELLLYLEMDSENKTISASVGTDNYVSVVRNISFCPFCGRKLGEN